MKALAMTALAALILSGCDANVSQYVDQAVHPPDPVAPPTAPGLPSNWKTVKVSPGAGRVTGSTWSSSMTVTPTMETVKSTRYSAELSINSAPRQ